MRIIVLDTSSPDAARRKLEQVTSLLADMMLQMVEPWPVEDCFYSPYFKNSTGSHSRNKLEGQDATFS